MDQIWAIKNWNIYSSRRQKRQVWPRSCWEAVELGGKWACEGCWQHDIFVGSDVMAHKRSFYGSCYCKERGHSKLLWERKSFATKIRRWEDRILLRGAKGMCRWWIAEQGQWDTGQSPTHVSITSITLGQWEASICLNMPITVGQAGVFQFCWLLIHIGQLQIKKSDEFGCVESSFRVNEK